MKLSPIFRKDEITSVRRYTLPALITLVNGCLSVLVLMNLFYITNNARATGEISYGNFLRIYYIASITELLLILLIAPALTASSISSERERKTLGLLLTTQLDPWDIVIGKLLGALSTLSILVVTSIPILATVYIYGGITPQQVVTYFAMLMVSAIFCTSIGIMVSSFISTTAAATAVAYVIIFLSYFGMISAMYLRDTMGYLNNEFMAGLIVILLVISVFMLYLSKKQITPHRKRLKRD